ncbi:MAG: polyprenyl synthetase family protein [Saprospiraceae bacterium]|nr:polyprenyl synthetase family protein [Saprospiraceae bacterium]
MSSIDTIKRPIEHELDKFEQHFRGALKSHVPLLDRIMYYIVRRKGKQVRPMFVFLSAQICGGTTEATFTAASMVELLHTATLVHDDVVDESDERRGFFSINALWKNKVAVLVGDYLFAQGLLLALKNKEFRLLEIISEAVKAMSEGELLQLEKARRLDIKESVYYDVIRQKTASLIAAACSVGAASTTKDEAVIEQMRLFGENLGIAFQIKDDLFDFGSDDVGKPLGIDIQEKKLTLPLIYALENASRSDKGHIINLIKRHSDKPDKVKEVIAFVQASGGLDYAKAAMERYSAAAFAILDQMPESAAKTAMRELVVYVTQRRK